MSDQKSFMIVDENGTNALFWEMSVKEQYPDAKVVICKTGIEALDTAKKEKFDFFLSSWELKPMSGLIFMQKVREIRKFRHTPFLIFSQLLNDEDISLAHEFGIKNYLLKPFDKARVLEKIGSMLDDEKKQDTTVKTLRKVEDWVSENKINEALKLINDCLKPGPHASHAYFLNGEIWSKTEHTDKAEKSYRESLKIEPNYSPSMNGLGRLFLRLKRYQEAVEQFEVLNKRCPFNLSRMISLGTAYLGQGEDTKAEQVFKQVRNMDSENADAAEGLGKVNFNKGNLELAAKFFQESGKGDELASYFNNLGIALVNQNRHTDAIQVYQNALSVIPDKTKAHLLEFNIGLAFKKCEKLGDAAEAFARSLMLNPSYEKAHIAMSACIKEAQARQQPFNQAQIQLAMKKRKEWQEQNTTQAAS